MYLIYYNIRVYREYYIIFKWSMYLHSLAFTHAWARFTCTCTHTHTHTHIHKHTHTYTCFNVYIDVKHSCIPNYFVCNRKNKPEHSHSHIGGYTLINTHATTYTHTYTCTLKHLYSAHERINLCMHSHAVIFAHVGLY